MRDQRRMNQNRSLFYLRLGWIERAPLGPLMWISAQP
jgi:hypothetical protein